MKSILMGGLLCLTTLLYIATAYLYPSSNRRGVKRLDVSQPSCHICLCRLSLLTLKRLQSCAIRSRWQEPTNITEISQSGIQRSQVNLAVRTKYGLVSGDSGRGFREVERSDRCRCRGHWSRGDICRGEDRHQRRLNV